MEVIARFVDSHGNIVAKASGPDFLAAVNRAYDKLMKIKDRPFVHIQFKFIEDADSSKTR